LIKNTTAKYTHHTKSKQSCQTASNSQLLTPTAHRLAPNF